VSATGGAFAIGFRELQLWSVGSFVQSGWHWPAAVIKPLATALLRKQIEINPVSDPAEAPQLLTIHFDGSIEPRGVGSVEEFKGRLYLAEAGDVVYSKIDVRNGAIGLVPGGMPRCAVSSEYPVYQVRSGIALGEYIQLVFRTDHFRQVINGMISGASGRKRVQPEQIELMDIPLPPLDTQHAIVARWQAAQAEADAAEARVGRVEAEIEAATSELLGLSPHSENVNRRVVATSWSNLYYWSVRATQIASRIGGITEGRYPVVRGTDCLREVKHGCSLPPASASTGLDILKISAVTRGVFDPTERKFAQDSPRVRADFDLRQGDILMCRTNGTLGYVGMSAYVERDMEDLIFPDKVIRVRTLANILPEYLCQILQLPQLRIQIEAAARTAVGNYAIGSDDRCSPGNTLK
jgi:type I restriction enzyme S subunit